MAWSQSVSGEGTHFKVTLANTPAGAAQARKQLVSFARHLNLDPEISADLESAAGEALANAAEHGRRPGGTLRLEAWLTDAGLEAAVSDDGPGFVPGAISENDPGALALRGYGLFLIQALMDKLEFRNDGKTVWFFKRL
jgi:anti-sigma regulatory factor (Ser/Thr protein kinase)